MAVRHLVLLGLLLLSVGLLAPAVAAESPETLPGPGDEWPHCAGFLPPSCLCPWPEPADGAFCPFHTV
jgi:hypothetical protein